MVGSAIGEGEAMAKALGEKGKAAILVNHGLLTVGGTVDEAGFLFGLLERCCAVQLDVERAGYEVGEGEGKKRMRVIGDREAEFNFRMASTPVCGWLSPFFFFSFFSLPPSPIYLCIHWPLTPHTRRRYTGNSNQTTTTKLP